MNEFKSSFNNEEELSNPISMNVIAYIDNEDILKVPQTPYEFMVLMPINNYQSILNEIKYPNEDMLSESIYLKESKNQSFEDIKNIINKNFNTKNIKVYNRENLKVFERNSGNMLFTLLSIFSLIAGAVGLSASYSATDSMRRMQSKEYALLQIVGMDRKLLKKLVLKEVNYNTRAIVVLSLIFILISAFLGSTGYEYFGIFKILRNMKIYIVVIYIAIIYLIMRRNYLKILKDMKLTMNRRML